MKQDETLSFDDHIGNEFDITGLYSLSQSHVHVGFGYFWAATGSKERMLHSRSTIVIS